jgi:hypothetical protein
MAADQLKIIAVYAALGTGGGLVWGMLWNGVGALLPGFPAPPAGLRWRWWLTVAVVGGWHLTFLLRAFQNHPAAMARGFHERGGLLRWLQDVVTGTWLGKTVLSLMTGVTGLLFLAAALVVVVRLYLKFKALSPPSRLAWAIGAGGMIVFSVGVRVVWSVREPANAGSNVVLIVVDSLGNGPAAPEDTPFLTARMKQALMAPACVPPLAEPLAARATLMSGRSPFATRIRHPFPSAAEAGLDGDILPAVFRRKGYRTAVFADGENGFYSRLAEGFDLPRAPLQDLHSLFFRRALARQVHLVPYLGGAWGRRFFPELRGESRLADPALLAREASAYVADARRGRPFFLVLDFAVLGDPGAVTGAGALKHLKGRPGKLVPKGHDPALRREVGRANLKAWDEALGSFLRTLWSTADLQSHTTLAIVSPYAYGFGEPGEGWGHGVTLPGPRGIGSPFILNSPLHRETLWRAPYPVSAVDVAPTLLRAAGLPVPRSMEGLPLQERRRQKEPPVVYAETGLWSFPEDDFPHREGAIAYPAIPRLVEEDTGAPGYWRLSRAWTDQVIAAKHRMILRGDKRLMYFPTRRGALFETGSGVGVKLPPGKKRSPDKGVLREWRDLFFQETARETGWRPQNDFLIPEAFLREEESP